MVWIAKPLALVTAAWPAILDARQATVIERDGARRRVARPHDAVMFDDQEHERHDRQRSPPWRDPSAPRRDDQEDGDREHRKAGIAQSLVDSRQPCVRRAPGGETCSILVRRRVAHPAII